MRRSVFTRPEAVSFTLLLLLREEDNARYLFAPLWAGFTETEQFYRWPGLAPEFRRVYAGPRPPGSAVQLSAEEVVPDSAVAGLSWSSALGRLSRTYDAAKLGPLARDLARADDVVILVTDQELTPPEDWRYIIWDPFENGTVISIAPTDPRYWRNRDPNRLSTIKHRIRTACISVVGESMGLNRCQNAKCLLYDNIDDVEVLDTMLYLGAEHGLSERTGLGYRPRPSNPSVIQELEPLASDSPREEVSPA